MRRFSIRPSFTLEGRAFKGLRGWSGKPLHPPLTDVPIAAYLIVAGFDLGSSIGGRGTWTRELWHAGTVILVAGLAVSVLAAIAGLADAARSSVAGTQVRRTINTHAALMSTATVLAVVNLVWRLVTYDTEQAAPAGIAVLSVVVALTVSVGATVGGTLVFDYGFNVETAGDSPVWSRSETDVQPGRDDRTSSGAATHRDLRSDC